MSKEKHIEEAEIVVDLSGGHLAAQAYRKRIKQLQAELAAEKKRPDASVQLRRMLQRAEKKLDEKGSPRKQLLIVRPHAIGKTAKLIKQLRPEVKIQESTCQAELATVKNKNKRLREIISKTAESFRQNNRSLTANQCNAWESIEKELAPKSTCICRSYFMRKHEHIPGCPALKEVKP